jgi:hypothetical protein
MGYLACVRDTEGNHLGLMQRDLTTKQALLRRMSVVQHSYDIQG